jgi:Tfp pilus assembly protein PilF
MDLSLLLAVEAAAADRLRRALAWLAAGNETAARAELRQSLGLQRDPLAARLLGLLAAEAASRVEAPPLPPPPDDWYLT